MEPQIETPDKTLESDSSPSLHTPGPQTAEAAGNGGGGKDPRDSKHSNPEISDVEKKQRRAERFGMQVQLSEEEKRSSRAERFGTGSGFSEKNGANKREEDKRKARAERFGLPGETPIDDEAKKKARLEKFAAKPALVTPQEEEKRKARALRFSGTSNAATDVNSKANTEPKAVVTETEGEA